MEVSQRTLVENADSRTSPYPVSLGLELAGELDCNERPVVLGGWGVGSGGRSVLRPWEHRRPELSQTPTNAVRLGASHVAPLSLGSLSVIEGEG